MGRDKYFGKQYLNQSNKISTDIFESKSGAMNIAPIKISGQYKIVVLLDGSLWLDDYTGRRVAIDLSNPFLSQVAKFLSTKSVLSTNDCLRYGGFQRSTNKYWHIPFYLTTNYPEYFVCSQVVNETISDPSYLYKYGNILKIVDLKLVGLHSIFDEILKESYFNAPLHFNWEDNNIKLSGYDINTNQPSIKTIDLSNSQSNQPYFEVLNNKILNAYVNNNIFFPKFLNIEFEFEYSNEKVPFNNFFGYLSEATQITPEQITDDVYNIKIQQYANLTVYNQQKAADVIVLNEYEKILGRGSVQEIKETISQIRFKTTRVDVNDTIQIVQVDGSIDFEYVVSPDDIIPSSLYRTFINICKNASSLSKHNYDFSAIEKVGFCIITIKNNVSDIFDEESYVVMPQYFNILDRYHVEDANYYQFRGITLKDVYLPGQPNLLDSTDSIKIESQIYQITDRFKFNDKVVIRLDGAPGITVLTTCELYVKQNEILLALYPIAFLDYNSDLKSLLPYDKTAYLSNYAEKFLNADNTGEIYATDAYIKFDDKRNFESIYQYVKNNLQLTELEDVASVDIIDYNAEIVRNMMFASLGATTYLTPNTLNIDKPFYKQNGNIDNDQLSQDALRFNWFLIKGECPKYLSGDIRKLRYFTTLPMLTSTIENVGEYCETLFLGVKYQLPLKYEGFQFATYINVNNKEDADMNYKFEIDLTNKTLYLSINKYLDFVDLIRGGIEERDAYLDLSFFYSVSKSLNSNSTYLNSFQSCALELCEKFVANEYVLFGAEKIYDWKHLHNGNWYICLKQKYDANKTNNLTDIFPTQGDLSFHTYTKILYNNVEYSVPSITFTVKNIFQVNQDYLWCEDLEVNFFDTDQLFLTKYEGIEIPEILEVSRTQVVTYGDAASVEFFGDYEKISTLLINEQNQQFRLLLPDKTLSLKESYFAITQVVTNDEDFGLTGEKTVFRFPEFFNQVITDAELINLFDTQEIDYSVMYSQISLFNRNQVWNTIKQLFLTDLKFKYSSENQVRKLINTFTTAKLIEYCEEYAIEVFHDQELYEYANCTIIKTDKNVAIWNMLDKKKVVSLNRHHGLYHPYFQLFDNEADFQTAIINKNGTLHNIYDYNFGGGSISATGIWNEVKGNIVSSLFCAEENFQITTNYAMDLNYIDLLKTQIDLDTCIITDKNEKYLSKINKNVDIYIIDSYAKYLLNNFYILKNVVNNLGKIVPFTVDEKIPGLIHFKSMYLYTQQFETFTFIFSRK